MNPAIRDCAEFPATHWTLIAAASGEHGEAAFTRLYRTYWRPLCAQARRFGVREGDVEDAIQDLMVSLVASHGLERARKESGRFRSFLLGALRNHLSHRRARAHALKRGGAQPAMPLDSPEVAQIPSPPLADTREFDAEWARALLDVAMRRFEAEENHSAESRASFAVLGGCVLGGGTVPYEDAARRLEITVVAVKSRVFRLRRRFHELIREEVRRTVSSDAECDEELRYLGGILGNGEEPTTLVPAR